MIQIVWEEFADFLRYGKSPPVSTPTIEQYRRRFCAVNDFFISHAWDREGVILFVKERRKLGNKNSTINGYVKLLKHIDAFLHTECVKGIPKYREEETYFDVLTEEELQRILAHERNNKYKDPHMYTVLYYLLSEMALRIEEALAIKWEHWKGDYIAIYGSKTYRWDDILITKGLQHALSDLEQEGEFIFPVSRQNASRELQLRCNELGIRKKVSSHTFRKSFATAGIEAGVNQKFLQEKGRWKSANSMDKYIRKSKRHQREVLRRHPFTVNRMTYEDKLAYARELKRQYEDTVRALGLEGVV